MLLPLGRKAELEAVLTILPRPPRRRWGAAARRAVERPLQVHGQDRVPDFVGDAVQVGKRHVARRPRVIDEHVEPAQSADHVLDHRPRRGVVGDVRADGVGAPPDLAERLRGLLRLSLGPRVVHGHVAAGLGKLEANRPPKPGPATGH